MASTIDVVMVLTVEESKEHLRNLCSWLRAESGRHMARIGAAKEATKDQHAHQLLLWAGLVENLPNIISTISSKAENERCIEQIRLHTSAWSNLSPEQAKSFSEFLIRAIAE